MKYTKVIQKPYCCVGACMEMILNRNNILNGGQVDIACKLGLTVPEEYKDMFPNAIFGSKPSAGYGTQIQKEEYSINNFFKSNSINLIEEYYFITSEKETKKFLLKNKENDILVCCHCATVYDSPHADWGHMLLVENIVGNNVILLDPGAHRNYEKIALKQLVKSIIVHGKNNGAGFYLIKKHNKNIKKED